MPLHDVDTTKADGKTVTLVVVEVIKRKDSNCPMYCLACNAGVLDTLYHSSYMTAIQSKSTVLGLNNVIDEWAGFPRIKERKLQHQCPWSMVKVSTLDAGAKVVHVALEGVHVLSHG